MELAFKYNIYENLSIKCIFAYCHGLNKLLKYE